MGEEPYSPPERGVGALSNTFAFSPERAPLHVYSDLMPLNSA